MAQNKIKTDLKIKIYDDIFELSENNGRDSEFVEANEKKLREDINTNYKLIHKLGRELYYKKNMH